MRAVLNEDEENLTNGEQRDSVQEETSVVSATMGIKWKINTNVGSILGAAKRW